MHTDRVTVPRQIHDVGLSDNTEFGRPSIVQGAAPRHHVHTEGLCPPDHRPADGTGTDHAESPPREAAGPTVALLVPATGAEIDHVVRNATVEGDEESDCELGHRRRVGARAVCHAHGVGGCGIEVDRVDTGAGPDHQFQPRRGFDRRRRDLGGSHHEDGCAGLAQERRQIVGGGAGFKMDAASEFGDRGS